MTRPSVHANETRGSRKESTRPTETQAQQQQSESFAPMMGGIRGIMGLQSTIGNRGVAQLVRNQVRPQPSQNVQMNAGTMHVQLMPKFKSEEEAIIYFEDWEEGTVFSEHAREVKQLLQLAIQNGWEDLQDRIEYAQSESEMAAIEQFKSWDLSNSSLFGAAKKLLEKAQDKGWEQLEDLVIDYVRKVEDERDEPLTPSDGLLQIQRDFLKHWSNKSPIPMDILKRLMLRAGETEKELAWLTLLLALPIPPLTLSQFDLITRYQKDLEGNDEALRWVIKVVDESPTLSEAQGIIELARDFDYQIEFALEAVVGSETYAESVREKEFQKVQDSSKRQKENASKIGREKAMSNLTRNQKKDLEKPTKKSEIEALLEKDEKQFTQRIFDVIDLRTQEAEEHVIKVIGPEAYAKRRDEYLTFFQLMNYDPATLAALDLCDHNFKTAEKIILMVQQAPNLLNFIAHDGVKLQQFNLCTSELPLATLNILLTQITCDELISFAASDLCLHLLETLHTDNVPVLHMKQLATRPDRLVYCDPQFAADYSLLMVHYTPVQISQLIDLTPGGANTKVHVLRMLRPKAAAAADLITCLTLTDRMRWNQDILLQEIGSLANGRTAIQLTNFIYGKRLSIFNRNTKFDNWVNTLCVLMTDQGYTVTVGGSYKLSGNNTFERECIIYDNGGNERGRFVVHYHPGAVQSVEHPYGSGAHIKPHSGNLTTPRIGRDYLQDVLKTQIPTKK
ncbi:hypothetical protein GQF01_13165 [Paenibacillus sp. 5J-6]|uniref:Uncharacterized protein n=1 Tax=Paenibacillus silvestris TaxID=2606219 RepID=A0A6L8UYK1_9BACL|nr:hypothetical protein [Paenibacillus silvestris]MZQ83057.1 hypothetical protein [Paenibacillus silvestris]